MCLNQTLNSIKPIVIYCTITVLLMLLLYLLFPKWSINWTTKVLLKHCTQNTVHNQCTQNTVHKTLYTKHSTQNTVHKTLYTKHCTQNTVHKTLYTKHCTQNTIHKTLYTKHSTQNTVHKTLCTKPTGNSLWRQTSFARKQKNCFAQVWPSITGLFLNLLTYTTGSPGYAWNLFVPNRFKFGNNVNYFVAIIFSNFLTSNGIKHVESTQIIYKIQSILTL